MSRVRFVALLAVALMALPLAPPSASAAGPSLEWWGPTQIDEGHHLRINVTVTNGHDYDATNALVVAELDIREKLIEAGWLYVPAGDENLLSSFHLDLDSVRVVAMTDLEPRSPGTTHGLLRTTEKEFPASDPARYEVPSRAFPGRFIGEDERAFDARTNPTITVLWRVPETLGPGEQQHYIVYFDTLQNGDKPPREEHPTLRQSGLDALFWSGASTTLYGQVAPGAGVGSVAVIGLEDDTRVEVFAADPGGAFRSVPSTTGFASNPTSIGAMQRANLFVSQGQSKAVRIEATKPVLAVSTAAGFVPSMDHGIYGHEFVFATTMPAFQLIDTVYFMTNSEEKTTVEVEELSTSQSFTFTMNQGSTPYPYTKGARHGSTTAAVGGGGCQPIQDPDESPLLPTGPRLFRATVKDGGPVALQLQVIEGLYPIPSIDGSATGKSFQAAMGWTYFFDQQGFGGRPHRCIDQSIYGSWLATGVDDPSTLNVTSDQSIYQIAPAGFANDPYPAPHEIPAAPVLTRTLPAPVLDRPLQFNAGDEEVFLFSGFVGQNRPDLVGPLLGADSGLQFAGGGETLLIAPFRSTTVEAELSYTLSGVEHKTLHLGADGSTVLPDRSPSDRLAGYRLNATRPVFVYPLGGGSAFLAGVPPTLDVEVHGAEYRGYLVDIGSASGLDPVTGSTSAATPVTYALEVRNLGRDLAGPLQDTIDLELASVSPGWEASFDRDTVSLPGGESTKVFLTVTPTSSLPPNALGIVSVRATSQGNPQMTDTLGVVTRLKSSFDVGLWFDMARIGEKNQERTLGPGTTAEYTVVVQNLGSTEDVVRFSHDEPDEGWSVRLLEDGSPVPSLTLGPLETRTLTLQVTPPAKDNGLLITTLTAKGSNNAVDTIVAFTKIRSPSDLRLDVPDPVLFVDPGEEALFTIDLQNDGRGPADVSLSLAADDPSWREPSLFRPDSSSGQRRVLERISMSPGESLQVQVNTTSVPHAEVGSTVRILLQAAPRDGGAPLEQILQVTVQAVHQLAVTLPDLPVPVQQIGAPLEIPVRLENTGNLDETLRLLPTDLPSGWELDLPPDVHVARNGTQEFTAILTTARGAPPSSHDVAFSLVSQDGNRTVVTIPVLVDTSAAATAGEGSTLLAQPGRQAMLWLPISNDGNTPLTISAVAAEGEPWPIEAIGLPVTLPPRANTTVQVGWTVPGNAPDGVSPHRLVLKMLPEGQARPITKTIESPVDVGRPDLILSDVKTTQGPSGRLVHATLQNAGSRDADGVAVQLMDGNEVLERIEVGRVRAGTSGPLLFLLPGEGSSTVRLEVDGNGAADAKPSDNSAMVAPVAGRDAPMGSAWLAGLVVAAVVWARRRPG